MKEGMQSYYKICRKMSGFTQEQAAEMLHVDARTISGYENGSKVPDEIVDKMADAYNAPLLAIWHLKENSPLGKYLPNVIQTQTNNDLGFQTVLAKKDTLKAEDCIVAILEDGQLTIDELPNIMLYEETIDAAIGKLISAKAYVKKVIKELKYDMAKSE